LKLPFEHQIPGFLDTKFAVQEVQQIIGLEIYLNNVDHIPVCSFPVPVTATAIKLQL
jgi:hypothetical protein